MAKATLSRNGETIVLPLIEEPSEQVVSTDIGKPNQQIQLTGGLNPRHIDQRSGIVEYRLLGRFTNSEASDQQNDDRKKAYVNAIKLADFIKSGSNGSPITLDIDMPEYPTETVVPQAGQESALGLEYIPGAPSQVLVNLGLSAVDRVNGSPDQQASIPAVFGDGPIQLIGPTNTI